MARLTNESVAEKFKPYLQPGEQMVNWGYGVKQPNLFLIIVLIALAVLPGMIAIFLLTKHYFVGLTNRRFVVLRVKSNLQVVTEVSEYPLDRLPPVKTSKGAIFTNIKVIDPAKPFAAKFHRMAFTGNREQTFAIADALMSRQMVKAG